jgi:hypothetical protein
MKTGQWGRRRTKEYEGYTAPPSAPQQDEIDLSERRRLNFLDAYYRGGLAGAGRLALLARLEEMPDDGISPATKRVRDELRKEYRQIVADLERYERMPWFQSPSEFGAAALGRLGGGMLSPESLASLGTLSSGVQGGKALWNAGKAALKNGILFGGTDPVVQGLNIKAGVQDEYSPLRTFVIAGLGALFGGGAQLGTEALGKLAARWLPELGIASGEPVKVRVYRVEGAPNTRILISETGDVIVRGRTTLFLNFGSRARAEELLARRIAQGMQDPAIKSFDVPQGFLHGLREAAIVSDRSKKHPNRPLLVDQTRAPDQFGLRGEWIDRLIDDIIAGSGTVER